MATKKLKKISAMGLGIGLVGSSFLVPFNNLKAADENTNRIKVTYHQNAASFGYTGTEMTGNQVDSEYLILEDDGDDNPLNDTNRLAGYYPERRANEDGTDNNSVPDNYAVIRYPNREVMRGGIGGVNDNMLRGWNIGTPANLLLGGTYVPYRFVGWNTAPDGTGTWYAGGQAINANSPGIENNELVLYAQFRNILDILNWGTDVDGQGLNQVYPRSYLERSAVYDGKEHALDVDYAGTLHYKSELVFAPRDEATGEFKKTGDDTLYDELNIIWSRIHRIDNANEDETTGLGNLSDSGKLIARFSKKLEFQNEFTLRFRSTWITPVESEEFGISNVRVAERDPETGLAIAYDVTFDASKMTETAEEKIATMPVDIIDRKKFRLLTYEKFLSPMTFTVADDPNTEENEEERGLNALITDENYERVARSDDPYIKVGGDIRLLLQGDLVHGHTAFDDIFQNQPLLIDVPGNELWARLFPTGKVIVDYKEAISRNALNEEDDYSNYNLGKDLDNSRSQAVYRGRSAREDYTALNPNDKANYSNKFTVVSSTLETPSIDTTISYRDGSVVKDNGNENISEANMNGYIFVGYTVNNNDGTPTTTYTNDKYKAILENNGYTNVTTEKYTGGEFNYLNDKQITMLYIKPKLIVNYVDVQRNVLLPRVEETLTDIEYDGVDKRRLEIDANNKHYYLVSTEGEEQGITTRVVNGELVAEITHVYDTPTEVPYEEKGNVLVHYVDTKGNTLKEDYLDSDQVLVESGVRSVIDEDIVNTVSSTKTNATYQTDENENEKPNTITKDGVVYHYVRVEGNERGLVEANKTIEVTYVYTPEEEKVITRNTTTHGKVIVHYVDTENTTVKTPVDTSDATSIFAGSSILALLGLFLTRKKAK